MFNFCLALVGLKRPGHVNACSMIFADLAAATPPSRKIEMKAMKDTGYRSHRDHGGFLVMVYYSAA